MELKMIATLIALFASLSIPVRAIPVSIDTLPKTLPEIVKRNAGVKKGQPALFVFVNPGDCSSCLLQECREIQSTKSIKKNLKLVAAVKGERAIDVGVFHRKTSWSESAILDSSLTLRKTMSL